MERLIWILSVTGLVIYIILDKYWGGFFSEKGKIDASKEMRHIEWKKNTYENFIAFLDEMANPSNLNPLIDDLVKNVGELINETANGNQNALKKYFEWCALYQNKLHEPIRRLKNESSRLELIASKEILELVNQFIFKHEEAIKYLSQIPIEDVNSLNLMIYKNAEDITKLKREIIILMRYELDCDQDRA